MASSGTKSQMRGWEPLKGPRVGREAFQVTPFMRLARTHAVSMGANALVVFALAGSIFFVDPEDSRTNVAMALAMTMVPFTVLAPMVGPWLDRIKGGRRWIIVGANALRVVVCLLMVRELESLMLYPLAFLVLMLDKAYNLAKSAVVPSTVRSDDELVRANSQLTRLSGLAGAAAAIPGGAALLLGSNINAFSGPQAQLVLAAAGFVVATTLGIQIPRVKVAEDPTSQEERSELRSGGILLAASAMALVRGILGFLTMLLAFEFQGGDTWKLGFVVSAATVGAFLGTFLATSLRNANVSEERILQVVTALVAGLALFFAYLGGLVAATLLTLAVGIAASSAKQAFDTIVQKDAPDSNRGRAFARFETRFQLVWVAGAFVPVVLRIPMQLGFVIISGIAAFALVSYLGGLKAVAAGKPPPQRTKDMQRKLLAKARQRRRSENPSLGTALVEPEQDEVEADQYVDSRPPPPSDAWLPGDPWPPTPQKGDNRPPPPPPPLPAEDTTVVIDPTKLQ